MTDETRPPSDEHRGGPCVIYRWPTRGATPAPARALARVLEDVTRYIQRSVVVSETQAVACPLWVAHCHVFAASEATPSLNVTSAMKQCGKTRLLEVLEPIVPLPWLTGRVSAAMTARGEVASYWLYSGYENSGLDTGRGLRKGRTTCPARSAVAERSV